MISYWEQQSFTAYDHIIAGAGIVGLSLAVELRLRFPAARILILERGMLPTGASTRNAGFACMGAVTELLDDLKTMTEADMVRLFALRYAGLRRLIARLGAATIQYEHRGSHELLQPHELDALSHLDRLNTLLKPITGGRCFSEAKSAVATFGFAENKIATTIASHYEGELHTGKMMRALTDLALAQNIEIRTGVSVSAFEDSGDSVTVSTTGAFRQDAFRFSARSFSICTNAFTKALLPAEDVVPGRGQVLITNPIPALKLRGIFHLDRGYYYFREIDGRVLIGGGRNLDFATEETTDIALNAAIQKDLEEKLRSIILPETNFTIAHRWSGIMAFGKNKMPIEKQISPRVFGAFRLGGMGVALGSEVAHNLSAKIARNLP